MIDSLRKSLFLLSPEKAHDFVFSVGDLILKSSFLKKKFEKSFPLKVWREKEVFGLHFPNPIGLAAGFDKNARILPLLEDIGFGFVETGTITPLAQEGNPKPRLFRNVEQRSILNRMGFNNLGMTAIASNIDQHRSTYSLKNPIGINIGKNKSTPEENAIDDYVQLASALKDSGDYFVVNVSSPNTPGLRNLQSEDFLIECIDKIKPILNKPVLVKLAADLTNEELISLLNVLEKSKFDGVILCNTTVDKSDAKWAEPLGPGGLSGKLLRIRSREMLLIAKKHFSKPIISVGGIDSSEEVLWRLDNGAALVQIYSELIFSGPMLLQNMLKDLKNN
jgi:dihydroorotate dehydrogenase